MGSRAIQVPESLVLAHVHCPTELPAQLTRHWSRSPWGAEAVSLHAFCNVSSLRMGTQNWPSSGAQ